MAADGQIVFEITSDGRRAIASIQDVTDAIQRETRHWDQAVNQSSGNMQNAFSKALDLNRIKEWGLQAAKAIIDFGKEAVNAASDLEEVQNVVDVTFGTAGAAKIQEWANKAGKQFGLTETQAKKFTSTLGAMMKSTGMEGNEIVEMSTNLSGLAADMASFYNLDFETAFQKIRSGISGETEPLKQLGINMSTANLQAYALSKGITKAFSDMSQGEQTMLRYQYIMSATADAQGDFARTNDGYANSLRLMETNIESLKTNLGTMLVPAIGDAVGWLNDLLQKLNPTKEKTLLDQINDIDVDLSAQLAEIESVKSVADSLTSTLASLGQNEDTGRLVKAFAEGANVLNSSSPGNWEALLGTLKEIDGLENLFEDGEGPNNISAMAEALSGASLETDKATAWKTFLGALSENATALTALTGTSAEDTKAWLNEMADAAGKLDPEDADAWDKLLGRLLTGIPGLADTDAGQKFLEQLALNFLSMGSESDEATRGLSALGLSTDEIEQKQAAWLATCKELVRTIPGLSDIIDSNTGEVKGGLPAIKAYTDEWERLQKYQAEIAAIQQQQDILESVYDTNALKGKMTAAEATLGAYLDRGVTKRDSPSLKNLGGILPLEEDFTFSRESTQEVVDWLTSMVRQGVKENKYFSLDDLGFGYGASGIVAEAWVESLSDVQREKLDAYLKSVRDYEEAVMVQPIIEEKLAESMDRVAEEYGVTTEEIESQTAAMQEEAAVLSTVEKAINGDADALEEIRVSAEDAGEALKNLADYVQAVRDETRRSIDSTVSGFGEFKTAAQRADEQMAKLEEEYKSLKENGKISGSIDLTTYANGKTVSIGTMTKSLQNQLEYLQEYQRNLAAVKAMGASDELLAALSDGSTESADYLHALATTGDAESIKELNDLYKQVQQGKEELTGALTERKLAADTAYDALVAKAEESVAALNLEGDAKNAMGATVSGIVQGIAEKVPDVKEQVDAVLAELNRLNSFGLNFDLNGMITFDDTRPNSENVTPLDVGMDYVPFDNYLAALHEGESVLTAEEARVWRGFKNSGASSGNVDYDTLGGVMRDNVKTGGNVYLDKRIVGHMISADQADSYRSLKRSGWQK